MKIKKRPMTETVIEIGGWEISIRDIRAFLDFMFCLALLYFGYQLGMHNAFMVKQEIQQNCPCLQVEVHGTKIYTSLPSDYYNLPEVPIVEDINNHYIPREANVS